LLINPVLVASGFPGLVAVTSTFPEVSVIKKESTRSVKLDSVGMDPALKYPFSVSFDVRDI
jgi:hypothetical protein